MHNMQKNIDIYFTLLSYILYMALYIFILFYLGYMISAEVLTVLLKRYSRAHVHNGQIRTLIAFDDFVSLCVRIRAYTGMIYT